MQLTVLAAVLATASVAIAGAIPPKCGTCNPISGQNSCDPTTSCINTGSTFHCACRAGYKASRHNGDIAQQFRLPMPNYEFLVFVPEKTKCDTLCDDPYAKASDICKEVHLYEKCVV
ncbi:hypothetical protein NUU61_002920 [Penicillium alfredii]|uniref:NOTCH1 EGF-like calcium-binding domain-containing protein n=1 Tax=Penicillium alfredii TaxID=1506179 RepID=A0A9W9FSL2_9EURO|nr:uncharacterized protein NUU61_002920 [Penicillium alfredii]KAJ5105573.1 hypothetical protein NUU61_002920 [Penicillium alfredii]